MSPFLHMLPAFLLVLLLVPVQHAKAQCSFVTDFGSGNVLFATSDENFYTAIQAQTTCTFSCDTTSTSNLQLLLRYGGKATPEVHDAYGYFETGCNLQLAVTSIDYQTILGYRIEATTYSNLILTCTCDASGRDPGCFSEDMTVETLQQGEIGDAPTSSITYMKDLKIGDLVKTSSGYQPVYSFGHRHETKSIEFVQIYTEFSGNYSPLELTKEHFVMVDEKEYVFGFWPRQKAVRAEAVKVGDTLLLSGSTDKFPVKTRVTAIRSKIKQGGYMPLTPDGTIIVNQIQASSYVSMNEMGTNRTLADFADYGVSEQLINQAWMSPYRMLCMGVSSKFCSTNPKMLVSEEDDETLAGVLKWLLVGRSYAQFADGMGLFMHHVLGWPTAFLFGSFLLVETVFGASLAPTAIVAMVSLALWSLRKKKLDSQKLKKE